jgi:hypothetical protein
VDMSSGTEQGGDSTAVEGDADVTA